MSLEACTEAFRIMSNSPSLRDAARALDEHCRSCRQCEAHRAEALRKIDENIAQTVARLTGRQ